MTCSSDFHAALLIIRCGSRHVHFGLVVFVLLASQMSAVQAALIAPTGLSPGDQYRLVFVTSTSRDATSTEVEDYNDFVANVALSAPDLAALGTTWKAIVSTLNIAARDNTNTNPLVSTGVPIHRIDGELIATNNADLWDGTIANPVRLSELGTFPGFGGAWTGVAIEADGTIFPNPTRVVGGSAPISGDYSGPTEARWVTGISSDGNIPRKFYAISGILTVVPEPSSLLLASLGSIAALVFHRRKTIA